MAGEWIVSGLDVPIQTLTCLMTIGATKLANLTACSPAYAGLVA